MPSADGDVRLLSEPRSLAASAGFAWLGMAWRLFKRRTGVWLGMAVIVMIINGLLSLHPLLSMLGSFLSLLFVGGFMLAADALEQGDELRVSYVFAGFKYKFKPLLQCTFLYTILMLLVLMLAMSVFMAMSGGELDATLLNGLDEQGADAEILLLIASLLVFILPVVMMTWFAPALICLHDVGVWQAMKMSLRGALANVGAFICHFLAWLGVIVAFVLAIVGVGQLWLPLAAVVVVLGSLLFSVVLMLSYYSSYKSVWTE